jgi:hypothetical protein
MISLEKAVEKIHELINQELGPLLDERTMVARNRALGLPMPEGFGQKDRTREKWPEDKLFIGLDSLRNFNIRAKIVGPGGMFVKCESPSPEGPKDRGTMAGGMMEVEMIEEGTVEDRWMCTST